MSSKRVIVGTFWVTILLGVRGIWTVSSTPPATVSGLAIATPSVSAESSLGALTGVAGMGVSAGASGPAKWNSGLFSGDPISELDEPTEAQMADDDLPPGDENQLFDVYGNEIESASEDYRIDPRGEMYERHSPDTALPRLGAAGV